MGSPFQTTAEIEVKFDPLMVRVKPGAPAVADAGEKLSRVGEFELIPVMVKVTGADVCPPLVTEIWAVPGLARRLAGIGTLSMVLLTTVAGIWVVDPLALQLTTALEPKFNPLMVRVKPEAPAVADAGERLPMVGVFASAPVMVKVTGLEVCPPLVTVSSAVPGLARRLAGIGTLSMVLLTTVAGIWVADPLALQLTTALEPKFDPLMVRVKPEVPAATVVVLRLPIIGRELRQASVEEVLRQIVAPVAMRLFPPGAIVPPARFSVSMVTGLKVIWMDERSV